MLTLKSAFEELIYGALSERCVTCGTCYDRVVRS